MELVYRNAYLLNLKIVEFWEYCFNKCLKYYFGTCLLEIVFAVSFRWIGLTFVAGFVTDRCNINTTIRPIVRF